MAKPPIQHDPDGWESMYPSKQDLNRFYGKPPTTKTVKTSDWSYSKNHEKYNLEKDVEGNIKGPYPEVVEVYKKITEEGTPKCHQCEMEMMVGDIALLCPNCNEKYHVGGKGERLTCHRPDLVLGKIETVDVPDAYMKQRHNVWEEKTKKKLTIPNGSFKIKLPDDGATTGGTYKISDELIGKSLLNTYEEDE